MLLNRNPVNIGDFALPTGTIVHSIRWAYPAFLHTTYFQVSTSNFFSLKNRQTQYAQEPWPGSVLRPR